MAANCIYAILAPTQATTPVGVENVTTEGATTANNGF